MWCRGSNGLGLDVVHGFVHLWAFWLHFIEHTPIEVNTNVSTQKEIWYLCLVYSECLLEFYTSKAAKSSLPGTESERKWRRWSRHSFPRSRGQHWSRGWSHVLRLLIVLTGVLPGLSFDCWERPVNTEKESTHKWLLALLTGSEVNVKSEGVFLWNWNKWMNDINHSFNPISRWLLGFV